MLATRLRQTRCPASRRPAVRPFCCRARVDPGESRQEWRKSDGAEKSPDGRRFIKTQEVKDAFVETEAYSQIFMELSTDATAASVFVNGIVPPDTGANGQKLAMVPGVAGQTLPTTPNTTL